MGYNRLQWATMGYNGLQSSTMGYNRLQLATIVYNGLQSSTMVYNYLQSATIVYNGLQWSQMGYIKFKDEELTIPKRGSKDIIFVSAPVDVAARNSDQPDGLPQARLMPGRPYELKTSSRTLLAHNSAVIIHLYRE